MCPLGEDDCTCPFSLALLLVCGHGRGDWGASLLPLGIQNLLFSGSLLS